VIAGVSSGAGKTTLSLAIMAAMTRRGLVVQGFKVGPDFIDPGYYHTVTGRYGRNLDTWMVGKEAVASCLINSAKSADISVIEGVMGMFDGKADNAAGSTAEVSKVIGSPVVLVIDCARMGESAGAIAFGYKHLDPGVNLQGFIMNNVGSDRHEAMVRHAIEQATDLPVVGAIRRNTSIRIPERHLGLVTRQEIMPPQHYVDTLADMGERGIDIDAILSIARGAGDLAPAQSANYKNRTAGDHVKIGIALDKAFSFYYHDNFDRLRESGADLVFFSPLSDPHLPEDIDGLYLGGGYPEVYAQELAANQTMASEIRCAVEDGMPVYAECGGLIYLSSAIENFDGRTHSMCGALLVDYKMQQRPTLGYREATMLTDSVVTVPGEVVRGHEFHYSKIARVGEQLSAAYRLDNGAEEGFIYKNTLASYIHLHFAGNPQIAGRFVSACRLS
jgi:cobyrinic acid a,c-diamide synthase